MPPVQRPRPAVAAALAAAAALALDASAARAQGRAAAVVLELPASARAAALGDAYGPVAAGHDAAALLYNPAQLAGLARPSATLSVERYLAGSTLGAVAAARGLGRLTIGGGLVALRYPDVDEIVADPGSGPGTATGTPTGARVGAQDVAVGLVAGAVARGTRVGVGVRWVHQSVAGVAGGAFAADLGVARDVASRPWGRAGVAASLQHAGGELRTGRSSSPLPRTLRAGFALDSLALARGRWQVLAEVVAARDGDALPRAGVEGVWDVGGVALAARAGAAMPGQDALARPLTLGAGLRRGAISLDYAWRRFDALGDTHRVGARWTP